jgi:hypothetical protein
MKPTRLEPTSAMLEAALASRSLPDFVRQFWKVLEPRTTLSWSWHLDAICEHLVAVSDGQILRLIINAAPRSMKSILVSIMWPVWTWVRHPETRWLFASYAAALALKHSRDRRTILLSDQFKRGFQTVERLHRVKYSSLTKRFTMCQPQNLAAKLSLTRRSKKSALDAT